MPPIALSRAESAGALRDARAIRQAETWFNEPAGELDREFGHYESGAQTDWDTLLDALETVRQCSGLIDPRDPPAALLDFPPRLTRNADLLVRFGLALERLPSAATMLESVAQTTSPRSPRESMSNRSRSWPRSCNGITFEDMATCSASSRNFRSCGMCRGRRSVT